MASVWQEAGAPGDPGLAGDGACGEPQARALPDTAHEARANLEAGQRERGQQRGRVIQPRNQVLVLTRVEDTRARPRGITLNVSVH